MRVYRFYKQLTAIGLLAVLVSVDAEQVTLSSLGMKVGYQPEKHWAAVFIPSPSVGGSVNETNAMQVLLAKDGKTKRVLLTGVIVPKGKAQFDQDTLTRVEREAKQLNCEIKKKGFTTFAGVRSYRIVSENTDLKEHLLFYCFYSDDKVYLVAANSNEPAENDEEIRFILNSIKLIK